MFKFEQRDVFDILGVTPVNKITDEAIWDTVISPMTKGLLGPIVRSEQRVLDSTVGLFPGDEVSNLNDHRLFGGKTGFVRLPYLHSFYRTVNGAFIVKRDLVKVEVLCWLGDIEKGPRELIFKAGWRDRRFDGTLRANDSALLDYPYDDAQFTAPITTDLKSVELSIYGFMPESRAADLGDTEFDRFLAAPFTFLDRPDTFLAHFRRAWNSKRSPGQHSGTIPDVAKHVLPAMEKLAKEAGYDFIEGAPSHYHVAKWFLNGGYAIEREHHGKAFAELTAGLERIRAAGRPLSRVQQSWVCVLQSLKPEQLPDDLKPLHMGGPIWPQNNITQECLWVYKTLTDKAREHKNGSSTAPTNGSGTAAKQ